MTFEQVRQAALARLMEFTDRAPSGQAVPYRRIAVRQQLMFAQAARVNEEYAGACATGTIVSGTVNLADMAPPVKRPEAITLVEIAVPGSSDYAAGDRVTIVSTDDTDGIAPRARLRNRAIIGVGSDLDGVTSIKVHYPYIPEGPDDPPDGTREVEVAGPYDEILVVDLARSFVAKAAELEAVQRSAAVALLDEEETRLMQDWLAHARAYAPLESRFR